MASSYMEMKKEVIECAICVEIYKEPKILIVCGHTFCDYCIKNMPGYASNKVECPICRKVTEIPAGGLPPNFVVQDVAEPLRKQEDLRKETTKSVKEFHDKVSSVCQNLNEKLEQWKTISEILNGMVAKSFEMIETTETMDIDNCHQILKDIDKMTNIVTNISTDFNRLNETRQLTVLQENTDNIFITNSNIHLSTDVDLSNLSIEEGNTACASATSSKQEVMSKCVLIIGGTNGRDYLATTNGRDYLATTSMELYNPRYPKNNRLPEEYQLGEGRVDHIAAILSDTLYVVGGYNASTVKKSMELFDPIHRQCLGDGPEMKNGRSDFAGVVIQNQLMVFGGLEICWRSGTDFRFNYVNSCESFNPVSQAWSHLCNMKNGRHGHAGVELDDKVYLIGGIVDCHPSSTVSIFDPNASTWLSGPTMHQHRINPAVAKLDNIIVVTGGKRHETFKVCEMLDPRENKWTKIAKMREAREHHVLVNCDRKLYGMGGRNLVSKSLSTVEKYDLRANQWEVVESIKSERRGFAAVIIPE